MKTYLHLVKGQYATYCGKTIMDYEIDEHTVNKVMFKKSENKCPKCLKGLRDDEEKRKNV